MNRTKIKLEEIIDLQNCKNGIIDASKNKSKRKKREARKLANITYR